MSWVFFVWGCGGPEPEPVPVTPVQLDAVDHLVRASVALRGLRPTSEELEAARRDPAAIEGLVEGFVRTPEFGDTIEDMHAEQLLVRADSLKQLNLPQSHDLDGVPLGVSHISEGEAPLKLVRWLVEEDLPYTGIVTSEATFTDAALSAAFGLPYDPEGPEWQRVTYTDGRPVAGLLSDNAIWRRHVSAGDNFHRGRANFIATTFLCDPIDDRDVVVQGGVSISDPLQVAEAVRTQPECVACHQTLDPLAAFLWGFKPVIGKKSINVAFDGGCGADPAQRETFEWDGDPADYCYPIQMYSPETEDDWALWDLRSPAFYGGEGRWLDDLGAMIAEDPRFATCTVRRFWSWLAQDEPRDVPDDVVAELAERFVAGGYSARELAVDIVLHERFRTVGDPTGGYSTGLLTTRPEQYARTLEALTGFRWDVVVDAGDCEFCWGRLDLARTDLFGYRAMAGGVDGWSVTYPTHTTTPTRWLVWSAWAQEAAGRGVERDLGLDPSERWLFHETDPTSRDEAAGRRQLAEWHTSILSEPVDADSPEVDALWELFVAADQETADAVVAWKSILAVVLADPRLQFH